MEKLTLELKPRQFLFFLIFSIIFGSLFIYLLEERGKNEKNSYVWICFQDSISAIIMAGKYERGSLYLRTRKGKYRIPEPTNKDGYLPNIQHKDSIFKNVNSDTICIISKNNEQDYYIMGKTTGYVEREDCNP